MPGWTDGKWIVSGLVAGAAIGCHKETGINPLSPVDRTQSESPAQPYPGKAAVAWLNPLPRINHIRDIDFPTASTGFLVGQGGMVLKTMDGGRTWVDKATGQQELNHVRFFDPERGIVLGDNGFIMATGDGGDTWKTQRVGSSFFHGLCLHPTGKAIAVGELGTLLKSSDHGGTWTLENSGQTEPLVDCQFLGPDTVFATRVGRLLKSVDGGETWEADTLFNRDGASSDFYLHKLHFTGTGNGYALNYAQPVRSSDGLRTWKPWDLYNPWTSPQDIRDMTLTVDGAVHLVGLGGTLYKGHVEDANTWTRSRTGSANALLAVDFPTADTGYAAGESGEILSTVDGGDTWQSRSTAVTREDLRAVHFVDALRGFAVGAAGTLLKTTDGGKVWTRMEGAASRFLSGVHFLDGETGCAVGTGGTALWTVDGGESWRLGGTGTQSDLQAVRLVDARTAYAGRDSFVIKTTDGGATWDPVPLADLGYAPGRQVGDGLFYTGERFLPSTPDLAFVSGMDLHFRKGSDSAWGTHAFTGREGGIAASARAGGPLIFAVGGSTLFRIDAAAKTLQYQVIPAGPPLRDVHCPAAGACFAVGDKGLILRFALP